MGYRSNAIRAAYAAVTEEGFKLFFSPLKAIIVANADFETECKEQASSPIGIAIYRICHREEWLEFE
jgi:hypothetical protein